MVGGHTGRTPDLPHGLCVHPPLASPLPPGSWLGPTPAGDAHPAVPRPGFDSEHVQLLFHGRSLGWGVGAVAVGCGWRETRGRGARPETVSERRREGAAVTVWL